MKKIIKIRRTILKIFGFFIILITTILVAMGTIYMFVLPKTNFIQKENSFKDNFKVLPFSVITAYIITLIPKNCSEIKSEEAKEWCERENILLK